MTMLRQWFVYHGSTHTLTALPWCENTLRPRRYVSHSTDVKKLFYVFILFTFFFLFDVFKALLSVIFFTSGNHAVVTW